MAAVLQIFWNAFDFFEWHIVSLGCNELTHQGPVTHICVSKLTIIGSDNGLSPGRRQAIIWTNAGILLIGPLGTNFSEILIEIHTFSFKKIDWKMWSGKWRPSCLGLNVLKIHQINRSGVWFLYAILRQWYYNMFHTILGLVIIHDSFQAQMYNGFVVLLWLPFPVFHILNCFEDSLIHAQRWLSARLQYLQCVRKSCCPFAFFCCPGQLCLCS